MKRFLFTAFCLLALLNLSAVPLRINYTNDTHGASLPLEYDSPDGPVLLGGYSALEYHLNRSRGEVKRGIYLDAGDQQTGTAFAAARHRNAIGGAVVEVFNLLRLDAATFGNHEFDQKPANLKRLMRLARYPFVSTNLLDKETGRSFGDKPWHIIRRDSLKIGILGLTLVELPEKVSIDHVKDLQILDYKSALDAHLDRLDKATDLIVLITHLGLEADSLLATQLDGRVDLIIGGHTHHWLPEPLQVNGIYICQAGSRLAFLGELDIDVVDDRIVSMSNRLIPLTPPSEGYQSKLTTFVRELEQEIEARLDMVIATLPIDWAPDKFTETPLSIWMANALKDEYQSKYQPDIAIVNNGGFRKLLKAGDITLRDMHEMLPFNNQVVLFSASGQDIIRFYELNEGNRMQKPYDICTTSAKGWIHHYCKAEDHDHHRDSELDLGHTIMDPDQEYLVVSHDYISGQWQKYLGFEPKQLILTEELILDAMVRQVMKQYPKK